MKIWSFFILVVVGAVGVGVLLPEIINMLTPSPPPLTEPVITAIPHPPWWILTSAALAALLSLLYPTTRASTNADTRRRKDLDQTKNILALIILVFLAGGLYLFVWIGWTLRHFSPG